MNESPRKTQHAMEHIVSIRNGKITLEGTLCFPTIETDSQSDAQGSYVCSESAQQAVLFISGSGPVDRNQNSMQLQLNIFNAMAAHLSRHGIATLRYDKRGCGNSQGDFNVTGHLDLVNDAEAWLQFLQQHETTRDAKLYLLGYSEGTLISPQLIKRGNTVSGQILLMPFVENFEHLIRRQAEQGLRDIHTLEGFRGRLLRFFLKLSGDQLAKQKRLIERIRRSKRKTLRIRKQIINAKWIREMVNLDPVAIHRDVDVPTLIIGGAKDVQCRPGDVEAIAHLLIGPVDQHILSDLTHILRSEAGEPGVRNYMTLSLEALDQRVLDEISTWLVGARQPATVSEL